MFGNLKWVLCLFASFLIFVHSERDEVNLGYKFPNFKANTTVGEIDFHDWLGNSYVIC